MSNNSVESSNRPILVTGAAGCIGSWVVAALVRAGRPVVAFDLSGDRLRLLLTAEEADGVTWLTGDITDTATVSGAVTRLDPRAVIHLAALQIPFCLADPVAGARVNVVGQMNVLEAVRHHGRCRLVYASSVAALPAAGGEGPVTLYGVYKLADEGAARIYWQDWSVPSIGLRPHTVYGPGRDQGLTSAPTRAILAAIAGKPFAIPFKGALQFQYAAEMADIFIRCADAEAEGAPVFDVGGRMVEVAEIIAAIGAAVPGAQVTSDGEALPVRPDLDNTPLRDLVGDWDETPLDDGVRASAEAFRDLLARGLVEAEG